MAVSPAEGQGPRHQLSHSPEQAYRVARPPTARDRPGPEEDSNARLAWTLDELFTVPGTRFRFGLDALIGMVPGVGDGVGFGFSAWIVFRSVLAGASPWTTARMVINIVVDFVLGSIPALGVVFDAFWKANTRNIELARRSIDDAQSVGRQSRVRVVLSLAIAFFMLGALVGLIIWGAVVLVR